MDTNLRAVRRGKLHGLICLLLVVPYLFVTGARIFYPENLPLSLVEFLISVGIFVTYTFFLLGILAIAKERKNSRFIKNVRCFVLFYVLMLLLTLLSGFLSLDSAILALGFLVSLLILFVIFGILSIRLAKDFQELTTDYGEPARKAAKWNKIAGYLLISVVLTLIGAFLSLIADYYMWRVLQKRDSK